VTSSYSGNTVTVTDQAGEARQSVTDGLGRLIQVHEDPAGLNYLTSYNCDPLDDLITVTQGSQTRTFGYDSLKRLTSAMNPESGVINYQYDANGNLQVKTDARGVSSHISYDALDRIARCWYNGTISPQFAAHGQEANAQIAEQIRLAS
jgi:YD repeat-containing protein